MNEFCYSPEEVRLIRSVTSAMRESAKTYLLHPELIVGALIEHHVRVLGDDFGFLVSPEHVRWHVDEDVPRNEVHIQAAWAPRTDVVILLGGPAHGKVYQLHQGQLDLTVLSHPTPPAFVADPTPEVEHNTITYKPTGEWQPILPAAWVFRPNGVIE